MTGEKKKDIMFRIKKLMALNKGNNATEGEIQNATVAVKKLLEKHQLSMFDVEKGTFEEVVLKLERETGKTTLPNWVKLLGSDIARALDCKLILSKYEYEYIEYGAKPKIKFIFIGCETDAEVAVYFFDTLSVDLFKLATREFKKTEQPHNRLARFRNSFIIGAGQSIYKRLKKEERESQTGKDLVVVKDNMVNAFTDKMFGRLKNSKINGKYDGEAMAQGREAGKNIPLRKGMRNGYEGQRLSG